MNTDLWLLFDIDGTLVDTDQLHYDAFSELLRPHGRELTRDAFEARIVGQPNDAIMRWLFPDLDEPAQSALADHKEALFRRSVQSLTPARGLRDVLAWADAEAIEIGVVTNAPRANGEMMLHGLGLAHLLPRLVIGVELERPKPDPLPYLTGLALIGGRADRTIAFEDSVAGVTSAAAAGLYTVGLASGDRAPHLRQAGAHMTVPDFTDPALWSVLRSATGGGGFRR